MKQIFTCILFLMIHLLNAQTISDFENFNLDSESFLNGSDGNGGFSSGNIFMPNDYNDAWESWTGWSVSNTTDVTTPGYLNQYSAITGSGAGSSDTYAVAFIFGNHILQLEDEAIGNPVTGFYITNSTYAYLSMKDGDSVAKKFGGVTGSDPDYFLLTIKKYYEGVLSTESIEFYLADYRFSDNSQDYIIDEWTYLDLSSLGNVDSLQFSLSSTDVGQFGMNTPAYFCLDQLETVDALTSTNQLTDEQRVVVYPNPTTDFVGFKNIESDLVECRIFDILGRLTSQQLLGRNEQIDVRKLKRGTYLMKIKDGEKEFVQTLIKN